MPQRDQPVSPAVLDYWRTQLTVLRRRFAESPQGQWTWFWIIQAHIIAYLLGRYAGERVEGLPELPAGHAPPPLPGNASPAPERSAGHALPSVPPGMGKAPRSAGQMRHRLEGIVAVNRQRYDDFCRMVEEQRKAVLRALKAQMGVAWWLEEDIPKKAEPVAIMPRPRPPEEAMSLRLQAMRRELEADRPDLRSICEAMAEAELAAPEQDPALLRMFEELRIKDLFRPAGSPPSEEELLKELADPQAADQAASSKAQ